MSEKNVTAGVLALCGSVVGMAYIARALYLALSTGTSPGKLGAIHLVSSPEYAGYVFGCLVGLVLSAGVSLLGLRWLGVLKPKK